jgi:hypothetical protein
LENGAFDKMDTKVMILPQSIAMSKGECEALRRFVARGGTLIADCRTALMDEHCKMLEKGQLDELFGIERKDMKFVPGAKGLKSTPAVPEQVSDRPALERFTDVDMVSTAEPGTSAHIQWYLSDSNGIPALALNQARAKGCTVYMNAVLNDYHRWRLKPPQGDSIRNLIGNLVNSSGAKRPFNVTLSDGKPAHGTGICSFRNGEMKIVAVYRNYTMRINELGPPEYQKQDALEVPMDLKLDLGGDFAVYNTRSGKFLGKLSAVTFSLDKYLPTLFTLLPKEAGELKIEAAAEAKLGELVEVKLTLNDVSAETAHTFRAGVLGPDGNAIQWLDANLLAPGGKAVWKIPFAVSDKPGEYTLNVRDVVTGTKASQKLTVK